MCSASAPSAAGSSSPQVGTPSPMKITSLGSRASTAASRAGPTS
jgi:hypothetical protein